MGGNVRRLMGVMLGAAFASAIPMGTATAQETGQEQREDQKTKYWEVIKTAIQGEGADIDELREAIEWTAAAAKRGRYLDLDSNELRSNADDVYGVFYSGWRNKGLQNEVKVEFLKGMTLVDPKKAAREVENAIKDKDPIIAIGAMKAAVNVDTKQAAVNILERMFDKNEKITRQAYASLYRMKSTPDALIGKLDREGKVEKLIRYLDIAVNYYLINHDQKMERILVNGFGNENRPDVIKYIVKSIEKTDIVEKEEIRKIALGRLVDGQYPGLMAEIYGESVKHAYLNGNIGLTEVDSAIEKINANYESAKKQVRGSMNEILADLYIAKAYLENPEEPDFPAEWYNTFLKRLNEGKSNEERVGAVNGLGRLLEKTPKGKYREGQLRILLDVYKEEKEDVKVRNAAAKALGRNVFDESIGPFIEQLEKSKDVQLREGTAEALYLYNENKPLTYNVGGIENVVVKEIKRITDEEYAKKQGKGSGRVLNYLLMVAGKTNYVSEAENVPEEYTAPNLGVEKGEQKQKPERSIVPDEIKEMLNGEDEEIKKAYPGLLEYYAWLAKANLLTKKEADDVASQINAIYEGAKTKKEEERLELFKRIVFASSALGTNYGQKDLAGIVAEILEQTYAKNPETAVYTLRILRADLIEYNGQIKGGLATDEQIVQVLEKLESMPSTSTAQGEKDHLMMILNQLIIGLNSEKTGILIEPEWPWEQRIRVVFRSREDQNRALYSLGRNPLTDRA